MPYKKKYTAGGNSPVDASYGLIFRLNDLWRSADKLALGGDLEGWNFVLDRIWANLLYSEKMEIQFTPTASKYDVPDGIESIDLGREDALIYNKFKEMIKDVKTKKHNAVKSKNRKEYNIQSEEHYRVLMLKDVWLRKFMQERKLYLKEVDFDPTRAMWGG